MTNLLMECNKVLLFGKVVEEPRINHEVFGEKFYEFSVGVKRLSGTLDIIPVIFSERLLNIEEIKNDLSVQINGQYRSYNNQTSGKSKLVLMVFAREIEITEEMTIENANEIYLEGFVCKKPNYRKTPFGREIADLLIAVNRAYNKSDYIPCIAWGSNAKMCESFNIGDRLNVMGTIQSRKYERENKYGEIEEKVAYEVSVVKLKSIKDDMYENNYIDLCNTTSEIENKKYILEEICDESIIAGIVGEKVYYMGKSLEEEICYLLVDEGKRYKKKSITCIAFGAQARQCDLFEIGDKIKLFGKMCSKYMEKKGEKITEEYLAITKIERK